MKFAFYVSGNSGRFRKVLKSKNHDLLKSTKLVVSDSISNSDIAEVLSSLSIAYHCFDFDTLHSDPKERNIILSELLLKEFLKHEIDYCFCFGNNLLTGDLLFEYKNRIINFHPSILPLFPGRKSIDKAVKEGAFLLGNTAHFIDDGIDSGPIIMQSITSARVFFEQGYDGILDAQLKMVNDIYKALSSNKLYFQEGKVVIDGYSYNKTYFVPDLR